jgi:hypothetical protein
MRPERPCRWTESTERAGSDVIHTLPSRLRALSGVSGVGVRVSLGASKSPANQGLSPLWKRNLGSARQPSHERRGCSHACGGNELTTFAWARGRRRVDGARRGRFGSWGARSRLSSTASVYPRETCDSDQSLEPRSCSRRMHEWPERQRGRPPVDEVRASGSIGRGLLHRPWRASVVTALRRTSVGRPTGVCQAKPARRSLTMRGTSPTRARRTVAPGAHKRNHDRAGHCECGLRGHDYPGSSDAAARRYAVGAMSECRAQNEARTSAMPCGFCRWSR